MVTGGSGFIGSCLIERLLEEGYEVLSFDLKPVSRQRNVDAVWKRLWVTLKILKGFGRQLKLVVTSII